MAAQPINEANIHNTQMLDRLEAAMRAARVLSRKGFVLAGIEIGPRNPVVWVEHTRECDTLHAAPCVSNAIATIMAAPLDGVQVQWQQRRCHS